MSDHHELLELARAEHKRCECEHHEEKDAICQSDEDGWPCLTAQLATALEGTQASLRHAEQQIADWTHLAGELDAANARAETAERRVAELEQEKVANHETWSRAYELVYDWLTQASAERDALRTQVAGQAVLLDQHATVARDLAAAREALKTHGRHGEFCPARARVVTGHGHGKDVVPVMGACDCGFSDAR